MYICDVYNNSLKPHCQRFSNNSAPVFTDEEVITVYLFCGSYQRYFSIKEIHTFAKEYLLSWFPKLPSYQTFNGECSGDYNPSGSMHMGDHMILWDNYDHAFLLPPVPARTYEIRISVIGGPLNSNNRTSAKIQTYLDDRICGSPIPKHPIPSDPEIGWIADAETYDNGIENDKQMRNRGWMKAPDAYGTKYNSQEVPAREDPRCLRKIIHRQYLGAGEHWLRLRDIPAENWETYQISVIYLDYIELVPLHIVSDPTKPEDRH